MAGRKLLHEVNRNSKILAFEISREVDYRPMELADCSRCLRKRYLVTFLAFLGMACASMLKSNLSMAVIRMTQKNTVTLVNGTESQSAEFNWSTKETGVLLSVYYMGHFVACLGGYIGSRIGYARTFGLALTISSIFCICSPQIIRLSIFVYGILRITEGFLDGTVISCHPSIYLYWGLPRERCRMVALAHSGVAFGGSANFILSGLVAEIWGWEAVFYVTGGIVLSWSLVWHFVVPNSPANDKLITKTEKLFLIQSVDLGCHVQNIHYPWKQMFTSKTVWVICHEFFATSWTLTFVNNNFPFYIRDVDPGNLAKVGSIASIPLWCGVIFEPVYGLLADTLRSRKILAVTQAHKVFIGIGQTGIAVGLMVTGLFLDFGGSIVAFCIIRLLVAVCDLTIQILVVDAFSRYSGFIKGLGISLAGIGKMGSPILMGFMTSNHTRLEWNLYFLVLSIFNIWSLVIFFMFGSGEVQSWARVPDNENEEETKD